jgi:hypothetical protein
LRGAGHGDRGRVFHVQPAPGRSCPAFRSPADGRSLPDTLADTVTISLAEPIRRGEQVIAAIDLTKPKGRACAGWRCKT